MKTSTVMNNNNNNSNTINDVSQTTNQDYGQEQRRFQNIGQYVLLGMLSFIYTLSITWVNPVGVYIAKQKIEQRNVSNSDNNSSGQQSNENINENQSIPFQITTILCHLGVFTYRENGHFYILCLLRILLGLFFPLDIMTRTISLDYNKQHLNYNQFHVINLSYMLGIVASYGFENKHLFQYSLNGNLDNISQILIVSTPTIIAIVSFILLIIVLAHMKEPSSSSYYISYQEFQSSQALHNNQGLTRKRTGSHNDNQNRQSCPHSLGFNQLPNNNNDSVINLDQQSLQLFESSSMADETERNGYDQNMNTLKHGSQYSMNKKKLTLNLDEIENISDQDLDSVKDTSARAATYNQFELTGGFQNRLQPQQYQSHNDHKDTDQTQIDHDQTQNIDLNVSRQGGGKTKLNISQIELITNTTDNIVSASSSHRRIQSINQKFSQAHQRNSLNEIVDKVGRKSSQFMTNQSIPFHQIANSTNQDKSKSQNGPYEKLEGDVMNQTYQQNNQTHNTPDRPSQQNRTTSNQHQNQQSNMQTQLRDNNLSQSVTMILQTEYMKRLLICVFLSSIIYQSLEEDQQFQLQSAQNYNLSFQNASVELMKSSLIAAILYIPIIIILSNKMTKLRVIKILAIGILTLQIIDFIVQNVVFSNYQLYYMLKGFQRGFVLSIQFLLYVIGIQLVKPQYKYIETVLYCASICFGQLFGSLLSQTVIYLQYQGSLPYYIHFAFQIFFSAILIINTLLLSGSTEKKFLGASSSDVLDAHKRLEQIKRNNDKQEKTIVDPAINLQYTDKQMKRTRWPQSVKHQYKKKMKNKQRNEQQTTNPQQPFENNGMHQLQEEDDTERHDEYITPNSTEKRVQQQQEQFHKRKL